MSNLYNMEKLYPNCAKNQNISFNSQPSIFLIALEHSNNNLPNILTINKDIYYVKNFLNNIKKLIKFIFYNNKNKIKSKITEERVFNAIRDKKNSVQLKKMLNYGGITSGVFSAITLAYSIQKNSYL